MKTRYILLLLLYTQSPLASDSEYIGCWNTEKKDGDKHFSLCVNRKLSTATTYYPNQGKMPTTCSQFGYAESNKKNKVINFKLHKGTCDNKTKLSKADISCEVIYKSNLICKHSDGYNLILTPIDND